MHRTIHRCQLISVVSHELRTPLTSIRGSLGLIVGTMAESLPESALRLVDIAHTNCERLIVLINDILDIDKIASGHMRFDMRRTPLASMMAKSLQTTEAYAQRFSARLDLQRPDDSVCIVVDEDRFAQVLSNLLSNAIKFSPANGVVTIEAEVAAGRVRVNIVDRGPGIPEDFHGRIFERFSQADSSSTRSAGAPGWVCTSAGRLWSA